MGGTVRSLYRRVAWVVAGIALLAVLGSAANAARDSAPAPQPSLAQSTSYRAALAARLDALERAQAKLPKAVSAATARKQRRPSTHLALGGAIDGRYAFWSRIEVDSGFRGFKLDVIRTDRESGAEVRLLRKANTLPSAIFARGGRVAFETFSFRESSVGTRVRATIYAGALGDPKLAAVSVDDVASGEESALVCGNFHALAGLGNDGSPLVNSVTGSCSGSRQSDVSANLERWQVDGSKTILGPSAPTDIAAFNFIDFASVRSSAQKLLAPNPFENAVAISTIGEASSENLWSPSARTYDLADDGSVALVGSPPPPLSKSVIRRRGERPPKSPLVLFPGGAADQVKILAASLSRAEAIRFCGERLFVLSYINPPGVNFVDLFGDNGLLFFAPFIRFKHSVKVYDRQGNFIRDAGKFGPVPLLALGCNANNLIVGVAHGSKMRTNEVAG